VTAVIVPREAPSGDGQAAATLTAEIQQAVRERKGSVHVPKRVIMAESLPLTGLGKLDKKALRVQYGTTADAAATPTGSSHASKA
jgi:fatty-acyl-CoA synthase